jgi:hypothetical protein
MTLALVAFAISFPTHCCRAFVKRQAKFCMGDAWALLELKKANPPKGGDAKPPV